MNFVTIPREIQLLIFGQLRVLDLVRVSQTCHRLKEVTRDPSLWKKLTLTYERIKNKNEACKKHVSRCSILREIVITGDEKVIRSDKIMAVLMKAKSSLTSITLSASLARKFGLSNASFIKIGEITQLTHLAAGGGNLGPGGISALACLTELRTLKVPGIMCGDSANIPTAVLVDLFSKLKKLEQVEMVELKFKSDEIVESLVKNNPNLHHLDITLSDFDDSDIETISSRSLILIADKCPQLTYIGIGYHLSENLSEASITKIVENCPKLKHANFEKTEFSDTSLAMMSNNCPDLEYLNIVGCVGCYEEALERFANPATAANLKLLCVSKYYFSPQLLGRINKNLPNVKIVTVEDSHSSYEDSNDSMYDSDENLHGDYSSDTGEG